MCPDSPPVNARVDRRLLLRRLGLAAAAGLAPLRELEAVQQPARPLRVIIVGAGIAGLCAAYELEQRGHYVVLLEAEARHVGGRVRTLRFEDGLYGEAGAMRIPRGHALTHEYIRRFNLPVRRFVQSNPDAYVLARSRRLRMREVARLGEAFALTATEQERHPDDFWRQSVGAALARLSPAEKADLDAPSPATEAVRALDQLSLQQLCERAGLSQEAIEFMAVAYGQDAEMLSAATEFLREEHHEVWSGEFDEIIGGTDLLATAFAQRLRSRPRLGCEVVRIEHDPVRRRAAAVYRERGGDRREEGDFLLCTLPFTVLSRMVIEPRFSGPKERAIRQLAYDSSTKVLALTRRRFWEAEDGIYGGGSMTDLPTGTTWYPASNAETRDPAVSAAPAVLLASYTWGQAARRLGALAHRERAETTLRHLARLHPQLADAGMVRRTASWSWDNHRWSSGAFAWFQPGQHTMLHRHVIAPEGRVHFAGEHASLTHTWIQGALESALRAVREMLAATA